MRIEPESHANGSIGKYCEVGCLPLPAKIVPNPEAIQMSDKPHFEL